MDKDVQIALVGAVSALVGALIGGIAAWRAASSTNRIQRSIAERNADLQTQLAEASLALQKQVAYSQVTTQKEIAAENAKSQQRAYIDTQIMKMIEIAITYPLLEKLEHCHAYPDIVGHPHAKERYESYCAFVFNMLSAAYTHFGNDPVRFYGYIGVEEILVSHHKWWSHDRENLGYDEPFLLCIEQTTRNLKLKGRI